MSRPIEDYALIGDGETAALVGRDGSIDWLCLPRFDDDACFAALLGDADNGSWIIRPAEQVVRSSRRYLDDTLVVETTVRTATGEATLTDFMPNRGEAGPSLVRLVRGVEGHVAFAMEMRLRFDYGALPPWSEPHADGFVAKLGPDLVVLHASAPVHLSKHVARADFTVAAGESQVFVLRYGPSTRPPPGPIDAEAALDACVRESRSWIGAFNETTTPWPALVKRSLLTLRAMVHEPSGGIVAAPTTSLPEAPGGAMNWDYRYCWLRDATFTLTAFMGAGFTREATRWRDWLLRAIAGSPEQVRIMYRVDGARHLSEWTVDALPGWRHAQPVRIGNAASTQHQIDVFGEVLECLHLAWQGGIPISAQESAAIDAIVDHLATIWSTPGSGIWESRDKPRHYTYSKVMAWVGVDRTLQRLRQSQGDQGARIARLEALRAEIHAQVCREGWNEGLGSFTQYYGGQELDASLLLIPVVGFLPPDDPRIVGTVDAIARTLSEGGLIRRTAAPSDGPREGAFLACSCWMADCLSLMGRDREAREQFERVIAVANDLGLFAEEYDVQGRHLSGNFPQALTHLAVVNTALRLGGNPPR